MDENLSLYKTMLLIRRFEERVLNEFSLGKLVGTTHAYIGQEADAAGIFSVIDKDDVVFSNHRCHGHFLAYGGDPYLLAAELMGKSTGLVGGRGGSQHIHWKNFYSNGVQGGIVPIATGMALAEKLRQTGQVVLVFLGDGTLGEGVVYESLNIASLWKLPVFFILENNHYAQTTPLEKNLAGSIRERFIAFNIPAVELDTTDVVEIRQAAKRLIEIVRSECCPQGLIISTYRFSAHSKGDDTRTKDEINRILTFDPLLVHKNRVNNNEMLHIESDVNTIIEDAFAKAEADPFPKLNSIG